MKSVIYESKSRETELLSETKNYIATVNQLQRECARREQELRIIDTETKELIEENRDLNLELQKVHQTVQGAGRKY
jgi:regulator of replication initiation timing